MTEKWKNNPLTLVDMKTGTSDPIKSADANPYFHVVPIEPGEMISSWLLRCSFRHEQRTSPVRKIIGVRDPHIASTAHANKAMHAIVTRLSAGHQFSIVKLFDNHSIFSVWRPFYRKSEWQLMLTQTRKGQRRLWLSLRYGPWYKKPELKICPQCRLQEETQGLRTWRVFANWPCLRYCPIHGCALHVVNNPHEVARRLSKEELRHSVSLKVGSLTEPHHRRLAKDLFMLWRMADKLGMPLLRRAFRHLLRKRGLRPQSHGLRSVIVKHFGRQFFSELGFTSANIGCHLRRLLINTHPRPDPLVVAISARALGVSVRSLVRAARAAPNDSKNWKCRNAHAYCGGQRTIRKLKFLGKEAELECPFCHLRYRQPLGTLAERNARVTFIAPNAKSERFIVSHWEQKFRKPRRFLLSGPKIPLNLVYGAANARKLPVGYVKTLDWPRESERLRSLLAANPSASAGAIRRLFGYHMYTFFCATRPRQMREIFKAAGRVVGPGWTQ